VRCPGGPPGNSISKRLPSVLTEQLVARIAPSDAGLLRGVREARPRRHPAVFLGQTVVGTASARGGGENRPEAVPSVTQRSRLFDRKRERRDAGGDCEAQAKLRSRLASQATTSVHFVGRRESGLARYAVRSHSAGKARPTFRPGRTENTAVVRSSCGGLVSDVSRAPRSYLLRCVLVHALGRSVNRLASLTLTGRPEYEEPMASLAPEVSGCKRRLLLSSTSVRGGQRCGERIRILGLGTRRQGAGHRLPRPRGHRQASRYNGRSYRPVVRRRRSGSHPFNIYDTMLAVVPVRQLHSPHLDLIAPPVGGSTSRRLICQEVP